MGSSRAALMAGIMPLTMPPNARISVEATSVVVLMARWRLLVSLRLLFANRANAVRHLSAGNNHRSPSESHRDYRPKRVENF